MRGLDAGNRVRIARSRADQPLGALSAVRKSPAPRLKFINEVSLLSLGGRGLRAPPGGARSLYAYSPGRLIVFICRTCCMT